MAARKRRAGVTWAAPRLFTLRRWHLALAGYLTYRLARAGLAALRSLLNVRERAERRRLAAELRSATSYEQWQAAAVRLDELQQQSCTEAEGKPRVVGQVAWVVCGVGGLGWAWAVCGLGAGS